MYESIHFKIFPYNYANRAYTIFSAAMPEFMKEQTGDIVRKFKTGHVKTQKMWSKIDQELTLDDVTSGLISRFKTKYGDQMKLEYGDDGVGRYFNARRDTTRMPLARLIQGDQAFTNPRAANTGNQSIVTRRDSGKNFVIDGYGQCVPRFCIPFRQRQGRQQSPDARGHASALGNRGQFDPGARGRAEIDPLYFNHPVQTRHSESARRYVR